MVTHGIPTPRWERIARPDGASVGLASSDAADDVEPFCSPRVGLVG